MSKTFNGNPNIIVFIQTPLVYTHLHYRLLMVLMQDTHSISFLKFYHKPLDTSFSVVFFLTFLYVLYLGVSQVKRSDACDKNPILV